MLRRLHNFILINNNKLLRRSQIIPRRGANDAILARIFGARGVGIPSAVGQEEDGFAVEKRRGGGTGFDDGAVAVGEERRGKADGGV